MYARPRSTDGEATTFGVSGKLWRDALVMYDRDSRSLWSQIDGVAKAGPQRGARLKKIPSQITTWEAWSRDHPATFVLVKPVLEESPYAGYHDGAPWVGLPWTRGPKDKRLGAKQLVLGIDLGDAGAAAVPIEKLGREIVLSGRVGEHPLVAVAPGYGPAARVFSRIVGERVLDFRWQDGRLVDEQTGSEWHPRTGEAVAGELVGRRLDAVAASPIYWTIWVSFHSETDLW